MSDVANLRPRSPELRLGRELALRVLYGVDLSKAGPEAAWRRARESFLDEEHPGLADPDDTFMEEVEAIALAWLTGVRDRLVEIDYHIEAASRRWKMKRMPVVDRNVLRIGAFELLDGRLPPRDVIYDAVELAKKYGDAPSAGFVNGVLDRIYHDI